MHSRPNREGERWGWDTSQGARGEPVQSPQVASSQGEATDSPLRLADGFLAPSGAKGASRGAREACPNCKRERALAEMEARACTEAVEDARAARTILGLLVDEVKPGHDGPLLAAWRCAKAFLGAA